MTVPPQISHLKCALNELIMNKIPYFIYLDTKIIGAAKQIIALFQTQVFSYKDVIILVKKYKHKSNRIIGKLFEKEKLNFRFVNANDIDNLESGIVFYPFNAQSNCRVVANRRLKHIFITHGESNKSASIKPIIRIYDYVITAGQAGIDRYLKHKIFTSFDIEQGRVIKMGDSFLGTTGLSQNKHGEAVIFYAPTWEGGITQEDYSSLPYWKKVQNVILLLSNIIGTSKIVIKPHPNTGKRLVNYKSYLLELIVILKSKNLEVYVYEPYCSFNLFDKLSLSIKGVVFLHSLEKYHAVIGLCDISAMETLFLNEYIKYYIFMNRENRKGIYLENKYYSKAVIVNDDINDLIIPNLLEKDFLNLREYVVDNYFNSMPIENRIEFLFKKI
ncbi:CDP-glycerol glycerophosphotransferase [Bibersteinia trehalosi]|uniref:CDP-glycerol glycerophosphotransferase n=1 Tax=Bibersteinia trehalosi TaxID=47735 RepID=UPI002D78BA6C|nr:CDP-glycerol glycerophosphotransferase [Bibersteinia trehalosi]